MRGSRRADTEPPSEVVDAVFEQTEGNPFFVGEIASLLAVEGVPNAGRRLSVPPTVRAAAGRRLGRLSGECNELLTLAAVVGREFSGELLATVSGGDDEETIGLVEEALHASVTDETGRPAEFRFAHALIRETLLCGVSTSRRMRLHGRIAEALRTIHGDRATGHAAELACHFGESATLTREHAKRAVRYSRLAAEQAEAEMAWGDAVRHYEDCVRLVSGSGEDLGADEAALLAALGRNLVSTANFGDAWDRLKQAADLFRTRGDWEAMARATLDAGLINPPPVGCRVLLDDTLDAPGNRDPRLEAFLLLTREPLGSRSSTGEESRDSARARDLAESHDLPDVKAILARAEAGIAERDGRITEALRLSRGVVEHFRAAGVHARACRTLNGLGITAWVAGRIDEAESIFAELRDYSRETHNRYNEQTSLYNLAQLAILRGDLGRARAQLAEMPGRSYLANILATKLAEFAADWEGIDRVLAAAEQSAGSPPAQWYIHGTRARALFHAGEPERALEELPISTDARRTTSGSALLFGLAGPCLAALGSEESVRATYEFYSGEITARATDFGSADELRGSLALRLDRVDEAKQHFHTGLEWAERERCPVEAGRNHQGLAEVATRHSKTADATRHLEAAAELFEQHGAKLYLDQVRARQQELRAARERERLAYPDGLSEREVEVLRLVAVGMSNRKIADELGIASATVSRHVHNILTKTGLTNRTEAATYAVVQRLVAP